VSSLVPTEREPALLGLLASADGGEVARSLAAVLARYAPARPDDAFFAADHTDFWASLARGGWLSTGVTASAGGGGLRLRDLVEAARLCSPYLVPVPLWTTVLTHRWAPPDAVDPGRGYTFALGERGPAQVAFADWPGIAIVAELPGGVRDVLTSRVVEDLRVAPSLRLARTDVRSALAAQCRTELAALAAGEAAGIAEHVLARVVDYSRQRTAYGKPIGSYQAVGHWLADMHRDVELAISAMSWGATTDGQESLAASRLSVRLSQDVLARAIQVYGGIGYTWEFGHHFYLRHVMALRQYAT
jgi:alkylation response protein AidB-like acyl-CoA dehydrogenase